MKKFRKRIRKVLAGLLAFVLTVTSFNTVAWADVEALDNQNAMFILSGNDIYKAAWEAVASGSTFDPGDLGMDSEGIGSEKKYEELFEQGCVYEIFPDYTMDEEAEPDGAELRMFVRLDSAENHTLNGDEEIIFLYINGSESRMVFRSQIDGRVTKKVSIDGNGRLVEELPDGSGVPSGGAAGPEESAGVNDSTVVEETLGTEETPKAEETLGTEEIQAGEGTSQEEESSDPEATTEAITEAITEATEAGDTEETLDKAETLPEGGTLPQETSDTGSDGETGLPADTKEAAPSENSPVEKETEKPEETEKAEETEQSAEKVGEEEKLSQDNTPVREEKNSSKDDGGGSADVPSDKEESGNQDSEEPVALSKSRNDVPLLMAVNPQATASDAPKDAGDDEVSGKDRKGTISGKILAPVMLDEAYYARAYVTTLDKLVRKEVSYYTFEDDSVVIRAKVTASASDALPEGAELSAERIEEEGRLQDIADLLTEGTDETITEFSDFYAYDIHFEADGEEVEPEDAKVSVTMTYKQHVEESEAVKAANLKPQEAKVLHIDNEENITDVTTDIQMDEAGNIEKAEFETDTFSIFVLTVSGAPNVYTYEDGEKVITATVPPECMIPQGAKLVVSTYEKGSAEYQGAKTLVESKAAGEGLTVRDFLYYDIGFQLEGGEIQPVDGEVSVSMEYHEGARFDVSMEKDDQVKIYHFEDNGEAITVEELAAEASVEEDGRLSKTAFCTDGFSGFGAALVKPENATIFDYGGDYSIYYILNHFNIFAKGEVDAGHTIGPVAAGGKSKLSIGGSSIGGVAAYQHKTPTYLKGEATARYSGWEVMKLFLGSENGGNTRIGGVDGIINDNYIDFDEAFRQIQEEATSYANYENRIVIDEAEAKKVLLMGWWPGYTYDDPMYTLEYYYNNTIKATIKSGYVYDFGNLLNDGARFRIDCITVEDGDGDALIVTDSSKAIDIPTLNAPRQGSGAEWGGGYAATFILPNTKTVYGRTINNWHTWNGHLVAPNAVVKNVSGEANGSFIVKEFQNPETESHMWPYNGQLVKPSYAAFGAVKKVDGRYAGGDEIFTFNLEELTGEAEKPWKLIAEQENSGPTVRFPELNYEKEDVGKQPYWYRITEKAESINGKEYKFDNAQYLIKVDLSLDDIGGVDTVTRQITYYSAPESEAENVKAGRIEEAKLGSPLSGSEEAVFHNKSPQGYEIQVTKEVLTNGKEDNASAAGREFYVQLREGDPRDPEGLKYNYKLINSTGDRNIKKIKAGETVTFSNLKHDTPYLLLEVNGPYKPGSNGGISVLFPSKNPFDYAVSMKIDGVEKELSEYWGGLIIPAIDPDQSSGQKIEYVTVCNSKNSGGIKVTKEVLVGGAATTRDADGIYYFALYNAAGTNRIVGQPVKAIEVKDGKALSDAEFTNLPYGEYRVFEMKKKSADEYEQGTADGMTILGGNGKHVTINSDNSGEMETASFINDKDDGSVKGYARLKKIEAKDASAEERPIGAAEFGLYREEGERSTLINTLRSDADGLVEARELSKGTYYFQEISNYGYQVSPAKYYFTVTDESGKTPETIRLNSLAGPVVKDGIVENSRKTGILKLIKRDADDLSLLTGAKFDLYRVGTGTGGADEKIGSFTTEKGEIVTEPLSWGSYYFLETKAPDGYITPTGDHARSPVLTIDIDSVECGAEGIIPSQDVTVTNEKIHGSVQLTKEGDDGEKLSEAQFDLYRYEMQDGKKIRSEKPIEGGTGLMTKKDGTLTVDSLPYGSYCFIETKAPDNYKLNETPIDFTIAANGVEIKLVFTNTKIQAAMEFTKVDEATKGGLDGAVFELFKKNPASAGATEATWESLGTVTSQSTALERPVKKGVVRKENLGVGEYKIKEVTAPMGYEVNPTEYFFEIKETDDGQTVNLSHSSGIIETVENTRKTGSVTARKTDETGKTLTEAEFTLYSKGNHSSAGGIINVVQSVLTKDYYEYGTYAVDEKGVLKIDDLPWDDYYLKETKAPAGYVLSDTHYTFTINGGNLEAIVGTDGKIVNERQKGSIRLIKQDNQTGKNLDGAKFDLYRETTDGSEDMWLGGYQTKDGQITVGALDWGTYYFVEKEAPDGYAVNPEIKNQRITIGPDNALSSTEEPITITVVDQAFEVQVDKIDSGDRMSLGGAHMELYRAEDVEGGRPIKGAAALDRWISKKDEPQDIGRFLKGGSTYVLMETEAPAGYTKAGNVIFTISKAGTITMEGGSLRENPILFENTKTRSGELYLTAGKQLTGRNQIAGEFEFVVKDETGRLVTTGVNTSDGSVLFEKIIYREPGEHDYTISEKNNGKTGVGYDTETYQVHVTVTDDGQGGLKALAAYPPEGIVFHNSYNAAGSLLVTGTKVLTGRDFKAGDRFTFELRRDGIVVDQAVIEPTGGRESVFELRDDTLTQGDAGKVYRYEVREAMGGQTKDGVMYDSRVYTAEYRIDDNGGTIIPVRISGETLSDVVFTNSYRTGEAEFTIRGTKHMSGRDFRDGDSFTFKAEKDGLPYGEVTIVPETGDIKEFSFATDHYTAKDAGKSFHYKVWETKGSIYRVTYSTAVYDVVVHVQDNGDGTLTAMASMGGEAFSGADFTNVYRQPGGGSEDDDTGRGGDPGPSGTDTTVEVNPTPVPLANIPVKGSSSDNLFILDDGNIPLAGLPKTGDRGNHMGLASMLSGLLLAVYMTLNSRRKKKD